MREKQSNLEDHLRSLGDPELSSDPATSIPSSAEAPPSLEAVPASVVAITADERSGIGFVVDAGGKIVTSCRLVESVSRIKIKTSCGDVFLGKLIRKDASRDLALVQVAADSPSHLTLGDSSSVDVGEEVFVFGMSREPTRVTITALRRIDDTALIQIDMPIAPGDGGGPVVTSHGRVVGISTLKEDRQNATTGFAVSVNELKAFIYAR